ncbi:MAG: hypothetical protein IT336_11980, partial [Thermomicrobiales bacterium]|nr:hypothetical protein [Thermomicrobiales bacterium]
MKLSGHGPTKLFVAFLLAALILPMIPAVGNPQLTNAASPSPMPNLPAIAITPSDIEAVGLSNFALAWVGGFSTGWMTMGETAGDSIAATDIVDLTVRAPVDFEFVQVGWLQGYRRVFAIPNPLDPTYVRASIVSDVAEYEDAASADAALTLLMDGGTPRDTDGAEIGDRVEARLAMAGIGVNRMVVSFTRENLVGTIQIFSHSETFGLELAPALLLAETLDQRIEIALEDPEPGIADLVLHFAEPGSSPDFETYWRAGGEDYPNYGQLPEDFEAKSSSFADAESVYELQQSFPAPPGDFAPLRYIARLYHFPSESSASAWLNGMPAALAEEVASYPDTFEVELIED